RGHREPDALLPEPLESVGGRQAERPDVDLDEVRLYLLEVDRNAGRIEPLREAACARVVVGEPLDVVLERVDPGGRDDAGLPHGAAEEVLQPARLRRQLGRTGDKRAERAAEALRETERDRVEV